MRVRVRVSVGRHFNESAHTQKNPKNPKYNFVEQFQRSGIPCPRSPRSFGNQTAVNPLLIATFAEQVKQTKKTKRHTGGRPFLRTLKRVDEPVVCLGLMHLHSPSYRNLTWKSIFQSLDREREKLPEQSHEQFCAGDSIIPGEIRSRIISALHPRSESWI